MAEHRDASADGAAVGVRKTQPQILVCPDKFRGSLTASEAALAIAEGLREGTACRPVVLPVADGGEGTVDCCLGVGFAVRDHVVRGADGRRVRARTAISGSRAVIESAQACVLREGTASPRAAGTATSFGVGELIRATLDEGVREIVVGVGGTACTDGGAGMLQALGAELIDAGGTPISPGGAGLIELASVDLRGLDRRLADTRLLVATDVDNPLLGPAGTASVFGPQKGADDAGVALLERGLERWSGYLTAHRGRDDTRRSGAGAGGGIGYGLLVAGAHRLSGAQTVLDLLGFDDHARNVELVVTGEGSLDATSLGGKAPTALAGRARNRGIPVFAAVGRSTLTPAQLMSVGIDGVYQLVDLAGSTEQSIRDARRLLVQVGRYIAAWFDGTPAACNVITMRRAEPTPAGQKTGAPLSR